MDMLTSRVTDATLWYAAQMQDAGNWLRMINGQWQDEILRALEYALRQGSQVERISREDFPLPQYSARLAEIGRQLDEGTGFCVLRKLPIEGLSIAEMELLYAGVTSHLGVMINQDTQGTLIDHVYDRGNSYDNIAVRGYTTNAQLTPHCDSGDLVGLLCVRTAKQGGMNNISCSMAVYNEILASHPEYIESLYRGFYYNIRGNGPFGEYRDVTAHRVPVYSYYQQRLSCRFNQKAMLTAEQLPNVPPLTELEKEAIDCVAKLAMREDIRFDLYLEPGDLALLNNHTVLHNRDWFVDYPEPEKKRLLLRQWINLHEARELSFDFADHYNTGARQGPAVQQCHEDQYSTTMETI